MNEDTAFAETFDLIRGLCLEAGAIMEEVSAEIALALPKDVRGASARIELLHHAAADIAALANAAQALLHRR